MVAEPLQRSRLSPAGAPRPAAGQPSSEQAPPGAPDRHRAPFSGLRRTLGLVILGAVAAIAIGAAAATYTDYRHAVADVGRQASILARALEEHAVHTILAADGALIDVVDDIESGSDARTRDPARMSTILKAKVANLPQLRIMHLVNEHGEMGPASVALGAYPNLSERAYFVHHRDVADRALRIGMPMQTKSDGRWFISLTRRINKPDGSFGGVVLAAIDPEYFSAFYKNLEIGMDGVVMVLREDGATLVRAPTRNEVYGLPLDRVIDDTPPAAGDKEVAVFVARSFVDGKVRIYACRTLASPKLSVLVGLGRDEALAPWRRDAIAHALIALAGMAITASLGFMLFRNLRAAETTAAQLQQAESDYRSVFDNATEGIFRTAPGGRWLRVNDAFARMHGYRSAEEFMATAPPPGPHWYADSQAYGRLMEHMAAEGRIVNFEAEIYRQLSGERIWTSENARAVAGPDGIVVYHEGSVLDITERKRSELALRDSEKRFRTLVDNIPGAVYRSHLSAPLTVLFASEGMARITGIPVADLASDKARSFAALVHPECKARLLRVYAEESPYRVEYRLRHVSGEWRWVEEFGRRIVDSTGSHPPYIDGVMFDITEHKRQEETLARTSAQLGATFENMGEGISLVDAELRFIGWNKRFLELLDVPERLMYPGVPFEDLIRFNAERGEYGPGDATEQTRARVELARRFEVHRFERTRSDGTVLEIRGRPMPGGGFVSTYIDVTERKRAEEARNEALAREQVARALLVDAIESISEGFVLYDGQERFVMCNSRYREFYPDTADLHVPGTTYETILRQAVARGQFVLAPGTDIEAHVAARIERFRNPGEPVIRHLTSGRWVQIGERRTRDGGLVSIRTDITALKENERALVEARDQAQAASRSKSEFLASVSHELRTPLHAILGLAEVVRDQQPVAEYETLVKNYATIIHNSGQHLLDLINDILDMSKVEAGRFELQEGTVDLAEVVKACLLILRGRAEKGGVTVENRMGSLAPLVRGDRRAIMQVVLNLLSNAVKFTPRGGRVLVDAWREADRTTALSVVDTGIGIAAEDLPKVTEPFWQADQGATRKYEGTGLGLAISKRFIDLHAGRLDIESTKGKGTAATIRFPAERALDA